MATSLVDAVPWALTALSLRCIKQQRSANGGSKDIEEYRDLAKKVLDLHMLLRAMALAGVFRNALCWYSKVAQDIKFPPWVKYRMAIAAPERCRHAQNYFLGLKQFFKIVSLCRPMLGCDAVMCEDGSSVDSSVYFAKEVQDRETLPLFSRSLLRFLLLFVSHWETTPIGRPRAEVKTKTGQAAGFFPAQSVLSPQASDRFRHACDTRWFAPSVMKEFVRELPQVLAKGRLAGEEVLVDGAQRSLGGLTDWAKLEDIVQSVLLEASALAARLGDTWEDVVVGPTGVPRRQRLLLESMVKCWDFRNLGPHADGDADAFIEAWRILQPGLQYTEWPPPGWQQGGITFTMRAWPNEDVLRDQYKKLMSSITSFLKGEDSKMCMRVVGYKVGLVAGRLNACGRRPKQSARVRSFQSFPNLRRGKSSVLAQAKELSHMPLIERDPFFIWPNMLAPRSSIWRKTLHVPSQQQSAIGDPCQFQQGDIAVIRSMKFSKHLNGCIVKVVEVIHELCEDALMAALETRRDLSSQEWHALRILLRCRRTGRSMAHLEGWNSLLGLLTSARHFSGSLHDLLCGLNLRISGITCVGGDDEEFIHALALRWKDLRPDFRPRYKLPLADDIAKLRFVESEKYMWRGVDWERIMGPGESAPTLRTIAKARVISKRNVANSRLNKGDGEGCTLVRKPGWKREFLSDAPRIAKLSVAAEKVTRKRPFGLVGIDEALTSLATQMRGIVIPTELKINDEVMQAFVRDVGITMVDTDAFNSGFCGQSERSRYLSDEHLRIGSLEITHRLPSSDRFLPPPRNAVRA